MKISYNWLKEFIDLELTPAELAEKMTLIGLEEEETISYGHTLEGVVVGKVLETRKHPNADRLTLCQVDLGDKTVQIVCGAPNVAAGQNVPVATVGTTLPIKLDDGRFLTLRKTKLRGELSEGMICAEDELGLGTDHSGIMVLDETLVPGTPLNQVVNIYTDTIIDFAVTPNRPDTTCHLGVARDLSAALNLPLKKPEISLSKQVKSSPDISISIENTQKCHRYVGKLIKGVNIGPSPDWLKNRLLALGLRPVNNVVDVTNYVMYELGQPLHAFDYDLINGKEIIVRDYAETVEFETLDHIKRNCAPGTLFICDSKGPVAIAGIMGGLHSEVSNATTNILLESAYFDPGTIRKTAKEQGLQTDASYRFERGIDPNLQAIACERAAQLIVETAGGTAANELVDVHPIKTESRVLTLRKSYLNRLLGTQFEIDDAIRILDGLELEVLEKNPETVRFRIPTFRPDLEREVDLIEEVGRLYDYNNIEAPNHGIFVSTEAFSPTEVLLSKIKKASVEEGFREIYTNSLISETEAKHMGELDQMISTINPLTADMTTLRPSLLHGFLKATAYNFNRQAKSVRFFETGNVFRKSEQGTYHPGIEEQTHVLFGVAGLKSEEHWSTKPTDYTIFDLKSALQSFFAKLNLLPAIKEEVSDNALHVSAYGIELGTVMEVPATLKKAYELNAPAFVAEFSVNAMQKALEQTEEKRFTPIPKFPAFEFDFAVIVDQEISAGAIMQVIREKAGKMLQSLDIFDVFEGEILGTGKKSLAFRLNFLDANKTLNIKEVEPIINRTVKALEKQFGAQLRG